MIQYGGPNSQLVVDRYNVDWEYALLNEGFVVACGWTRNSCTRGRV